MEIMQELVDFFQVSTILDLSGLDFGFPFIVTYLIGLYFAVFIVMNVFRGIITMIGMVGREW